MASIDCLPTSIDCTEKILYDQMIILVQQTIDVCIL